MGALVDQLGSRSSSEAACGGRVRRETGDELLPALAQLGQLLQLTPAGQLEFQLGVGQDRLDSGPVALRAAARGRRSCSG